MPRQRLAHALRRRARQRRVMRADDRLLRLEIHTHPFTAPAVSPDTICRWKNTISRNSGAVADTTAATGEHHVALDLRGAEEARDLRTIVWFCWDSSVAVTAKSL